MIDAASTPRDTMVAQDELASLFEQMNQRRARLAELVGPDDSELTLEAAAVGQDLLVAMEELRVQQEELQVARSVATLTAAGYEDSFMDAPTAYITSDRQGLVLAANLAARQLMTWPLLAWSRRPMAVHFSLATRIVVRSLVSQVLRRPGHAVGQAVLVRGLDSQTPVTVAVAGLPREPVLRWVVLPTPDPAPA